MRLHDLRGSYVTWLAEQDVDLKTASVLAGHSDIKVTAQIYQRVTRKLAQEAARAIERLVGQPPAAQ
ncbi:MAG: tyrosine-type recombinase/integrase [Limnochordaceae bacterium]|nr:tyrosine-type recombinase/integrase [Limnochordaceae bacterium]